MSAEQKLLNQIQRLSEPEREQLLRQIEQWLAQNASPEPTNTQQAVMAVQNTWASVSLDDEKLQWIAEDKELEYDLG
jgi:hypothetical protein